MEIESKTTVTLTPKDIKQIITEYLNKEKNLIVESIYFNVTGENDPDDFFSERGLTYSLKKIICETHKK